MNSTISMRHRPVLDHLRTGEWKSTAKLPFPVTGYAMDVLAANGWIERRGSSNAVEIRITPDGMAALTAPVKTF